MSNSGISNLGDRRDFLRNIVKWIGTIALSSSVNAQAMITVSDWLNNNPNSNALEIKNLQLFITTTRELFDRNEFNFADLKEPATESWNGAQTVVAGSALGAVLGWAMSDTVVKRSMLIKGATGGAVLWPVAVVIQDFDKKAKKMAYDMGMQTQYIATRFQSGQETFTLEEIRNELHRLHSLVN